MKIIIDLRVDESGRDKLRTIEHLIQDHLPFEQNLQDLVTLISARVVRSLNTSCQEREFVEILRWSRQAYGMATLQSENHIYLEAFLFFVLFHWQTENRKIYAKELCPVQQLQEAILKWRNAYNKKYTRQKDENNPYYRRETTFFYLGNGCQFAEIVYYEDLFINEQGSRYLERGDSIWQKPMVRKRLNRLQGTLKPNGVEVLVQLKSSEGNVNPVHIPTTLPIADRTLWNKTVFFFLGFTWSGPKAFDVSLENDSLAVTSTYESLSSVAGAIPRGLQYRQVSNEVTTNEGYLKKLEEINKQLQKIKNLKQLKMTTKEVCKPFLYVVFNLI